MAEYEMILTERHGDVLVITLNRPERLNACSPQMADEIGTALYDLGCARAVVITGAGRAFCAGADLQAQGGGSIAGGAGFHNALSRHYNPTILRIAELPVPVVCAVNGPAAGIGCSLGLAGDFTIAARSVYFLQAFVNIGLVPDGGASWMLSRLVGKARATEMMMLGERIAATRAEDWGLIYKAVDDAVLMDEAMALATRLAAGPTVALGILRRNIAMGLDGTYADALAREASAQCSAGDSADAREGSMAFLEKRKPAFKGA